MGQRRDPVGNSSLPTNLGPPAEQRHCGGDSRFARHRDGRPRAIRERLLGRPEPAPSEPDPVLTYLAAQDGQLGTAPAVE